MTQLPSEQHQESATDVKNAQTANENSPGLKTAPKTANPFKSTTSSVSPIPTTTSPSDLDTISPHFPYVATSIPRNVLEQLPFKTSNRILDDLRFSPAFFAVRPKGTLLRSLPFEYRHVVALSLSKLGYSCVVLNNALPHIPAVLKSSFPGDVAVTTIRGLVVGNNDLHHFKILILDTKKQGELSHVSVPKQEYHLVPREMVSVDDLQCMEDLAVSAENLVDDAIFMSGNSATNHLMRVSIYSPEFREEELLPMTDPEMIKTRYLAGIEKNPSTLLSADTIPTSIHCFRTLLKVLRGPILLPPGEARHTIDRSKTSLDAKIDPQLLFQNFGFELGNSPDELVPPDLATNHALKEAYIRKSLELVYLGKQLKSLRTPNEFDVQYSFSDNLLQVYSALSESDKASSMSMARTDSANRWPFFVALLAYTFYPEELIIKCFENTVLADPSHKLHYVDCFRSIISNRPYETQKLQTYYNNQYLKGFMFSLQDYHGALKALGILGVTEDQNVDESVILELYKAVCRDDYKNYTYFNKQLRIIAKIRESELIETFLREEVVSPLAAIQELHIEEATEDEVVVTAYEIRLDEVMQAVNFNTSSPEIEFLQKCLISIATVRHSFLLMAYIDNTMPELMNASKKFSYMDALALLGATTTMPDLEVVARFESLAKQTDPLDPAQFRDLRVALKTVAAEKKSKILTSFVRMGRVDPALLPPQNWPTGLDNIGNTCYLNSLLQYYFCIRPLRDMILQFDEKNSDFSHSQARKIGGRAVEESELNRSFQFVYRLQHLYGEMIHTRRRCVQPSKELAYLSFLPLSQPVSFKEERPEKERFTINEEEKEFMEMEKEFEELERANEMSKLVENVESLNDVDSEMATLLNTTTDPDRSFQHTEVIEVDAEIMDVDGSDVPEVIIVEDEPSNLTFSHRKIMSIEADQIESAIEIGRQQDVTECIENVTFQLETALEPTAIEDDGEQYDLVKELFCGKTKQTISPLDSSKPARSTMERFFSLIINVSDHPKDIYDALDNYFSESIVDLEEGTVKMALTILQLPEILQFHVQRVLFDRERLVAYKSCEPIPFGEMVYLDRYLETDDAEILSRRQEVWQWKREVKKLEQEREEIIRPDAATKLSILDSLRGTIKYLSTVVMPSAELNIQQQTIDALQMQVEMIEAKVNAIDTRMQRIQEQISKQFEAYKKVGYTLFAIFIHRGEASHGHYWIYIRDMKRNIYRKYNDDTVSEVPVSEVLNFADDNTATPYYMVYVKDTLREYIEPLKREIKGVDDDEVKGEPMDC